MSDAVRPPHRLPEPDRPWMMRTYAGHSTARKSNELYRRNLAKGQTGLSIAFDLPTQTGYDADHELARGEVGKVGVPVAHRGDMQALLDGIPPLNGYPTTWVSAPYFYDSQCVDAGGADVMQVSPLGGAPMLNAVPTAQWGLHLTDVDLALGDLVPLVQRQFRAYERKNAAK